MSKPYIHAKSSAKRYGGVPEDYLDIHCLMDSSKAAMADNRHRALTHNSWFVGTILEKIFGVTRTNSDGRTYSVRDIGEEHVLEDFKHRFIPSAQDYLVEMEFKPWMQNAASGSPESMRKVHPTKTAEPLPLPLPVEKAPTYDGARNPWQFPPQPNPTLDNPPKPVEFRD